VVIKCLQMFYFSFNFSNQDRVFSPHFTISRNDDRSSSVKPGIYSGTSKKEGRIVTKTLLRAGGCGETQMFSMLSESIVMSLQNGKHASLISRKISCEEFQTTKI
jgi:hypothetical protein